MYDLVPMRLRRMAAWRRQFAPKKTRLQTLGVIAPRFVGCNLSLMSPKEINTIVCGLQLSSACVVGGCLCWLLGSILSITNVLNVVKVYVCSR